MSRLDELLIRWQDGSIAPDDLADLEALLGDPANRAALVRHVHASAVILETLREEAAEPEVRPGSATERMRAVGRSIRSAQQGGSRAHPVSRRAPSAVRWRTLRAGMTLAAMAALVVAALVATSHIRSAPAPEISALAVVTTLAAPDGAGDACLVRADVRMPLAAGLALRAGDRLESGRAVVRLRFADEPTELTLAAGTRLALGATAGRRQIDLDAGTVAAVVAKQPASRALVFATAQAEARVVGTRLELTVGAARTRLAVSEGLVRFTSLASGATLEIAAAQSALADIHGLRRDGGATVAGPLVPARGCLWGVSLRGDPQAPRALSELETAIGRRFALAHQFMAFSDYERDRPFPTAIQRSWADSGRILAIDWKPRVGDQPLRWSEVAAGDHDAAYVDVLARKAAAWGKPFMLSLHHDPEEAIGPAGSGMTADDYVRMWRHVHARFAAAGARQVVWVWTMTGLPAAADTWTACYPGDDCVDWLACTAYNNSHAADEPTRHWRGFAELVEPFVAWSRGRSGVAKPIMISVYACAEAASGAPGKESWFRAMPEELGRFPEIKALAYFHDRALRADTTPAALAGFRAAAADPAFRTDPPTDARAAGVSDR